MLLFLSALRAVVELVGLCAIGQGVLYVLAGSHRADNVIYRLFALVTAPPRNLAPPLAAGWVWGACQRPADGRAVVRFVGRFSLVEKKCLTSLLRGL